MEVLFATGTRDLKKKTVQMVYARGLYIWQIPTFVSVSLKREKLVKKQTRKQPQINNYLVLCCIEKKYKNYGKGRKIISKY